MDPTRPAGTIQASPSRAEAAMPLPPLDEALRHLLALPRQDQPAEVARIRATHPPPADREAWNTLFEPGSLYEAWTRTTVMEGLYRANAHVLREALAGRRGWRVLEVGGGDGALWAHALAPDAEGELVVVDPLPSVPARVAARVPHGVRVTARTARVEDVVGAGSLPPCDAVVCSLALHHLAGADAAERRRHGLCGLGKREVLKAFQAAIQPRGGTLVLNEADVFCDLGLPPGDPILVDRILDSYVRRTVASLLDDLATRTDTDADLQERWRAIARRWCLDQVDVAFAPVADRDVYELDVPRWLDLLREAGVAVVSRTFTDRYGLFCQYVGR